MKKKKTLIYSINNISERQLNIILKALDVYTRLGVLQLDRAILDDIRFDPKFDFTRDLDSIEKHLGDIKRMMIRNHSDADIRDKANGYANNWSLGIRDNRVPKSVQSAYDMFKVLANKQWKDIGTDGFSVYSDEGFKLTDDPKIKVESEDERKIKLKNILNDDI
jgi:hypothetical protein